MRRKAHSRPARCIHDGASRRGAPAGSWLARMLGRKPIPVVAVVLANKMARGIWAMLSRDENYRGPVLISA